MDTQTQKLSHLNEEFTRGQSVKVSQASSSEAAQVNKVKSSKPRFSKTLSFHLLLLFVILSTCVILVLDVAFTAFSYRATLNDVDQSLIDSADNVRDRYILHAITAADPSAEQHALFSLSDHYIHIHFQVNPYPSSTDNTADTPTDKSATEVDAASVNHSGTDSISAPTAYTASTKRSYMVALPYADDDDDDDNDDKNDHDDDNDNDDDDDLPPQKNTNGNNSNTGSGGNKSNANTGGNNSGTGTGGSKSGGNTNGRSGTGNSSNNLDTGETDNSVSTGEDPSTYKPPSDSIVIADGYLIYTQEPQKSVIQQYGLPKNLEEMERTLSEKPQTVEGTATSDWRAVSVPIINSADNTTIGYVVMARPLAPVLDSVRQTSLYLGLFGLGIVALGSLLAYYLIRRSLRSLHAISESTHSIAAGDLTQRVPSGPKGSEVGMLSDSINVMLNQIEHSFEVKDQSEAKMRQFVSDASHELRTPLATVRGYAELYRLGGVPEGEMSHAMSRIESESNRMGVLVSDLLQLARLDEGRPLNIETVDMSDVVENALSDFRVRDPEREVRLVGLNGETATPTIIDGDKDKIEQVIANLLSNVQTHTPPGTPVDIAVGKVLTLDKNHDGSMSEQAVVEVRDHGTGVPEKEREKIFERFFRTDSSRSRDSGGSGLGLSIVSSVMQAHGGYAQALETDGGGLTVRLVFPTAPVPAAPATVA